MKKRYSLENLDCASCAQSIEDGLKRIPEIREATIDFSTASLNVDTDDPDSLKDHIKRIDPTVKLVDRASATDDAENANTTRLAWARLIGSAVLLIIAMFVERSLHESSIRWVEYVLFGSAYLLCGASVVYRAFKNITRGRVFDENLLMTIATFGAFAIHELPEAVAVMLFYGVGEILQDRAVNRSRSSIRRLLDLRPDVVRVETADGMISIPTEELEPGTVMVVRPGERVAADGVVAGGSGYVDTAAITGEPRPRHATEGSEILAGYLSVDGVLRVTVEKRPDESSAARIIELVENASSAKARTEAFITRFARYYTPAVVGIALLVAFLPPLLGGGSFDEWVYRALTILVISCPCALVVSIPLSYFSGIGGASSKGILVKGASFFDTLSKVRTVVFDKTGTLTHGEFDVQEVVPHNGYSRDDVLGFAYQAESQSNHPIAQSIMKTAGAGHPYNESTNVEFEERSGLGVIAKVDGARIIAGNDRLLHEEQIDHDTCDVKGTVVHVAVSGKYAGYVVIGDRLRDGSRDLVPDLASVGVRETVMLTGDRSEDAESLAQSMGVHQAFGDLLPGDKVSKIEEIIGRQQAGDRTAFLGDGINDAPVIARADVGIAMGSNGTDAAIETADVVIMQDDPAKVSEAIRRARKTRRIVLQNIIGALAVKIVLVTLGAAGLATMWEAVIADVGVTLVAVLNAARALR